MSGKFVYKTGFCHLVRAAEQCTFLLIDLCIIVVERTEGSLCQKLVNDIFSCELGGNLGRAGQKLVGFGINLRLVVLDPQNFGGNVIRADRMAKQLPDALFSVMFI